jgi:hypothetical protein
MDKSGRKDPDPDLVIDLLGGLAQGATEVIKLLERLIPEAQPAKNPVVTQISYRDIVRYFQEKQPNEFDVAAGALFRRRAAGGIVLYQVFLDDTDHVIIDARGMPLGRALRALDIDDELHQKFGRTDLIIFR